MGNEGVLCKKCEAEEVRTELFTSCIIVLRLCMLSDLAVKIEQLLTLVSHGLTCQLETFTYHSESLLYQQVF